VAQVTDRLSSHVEEVAALSANFGFLLPHQPLLVLCGAEAEVSIFDDPSRTLLKCREFGQILAIDLLHRAGMTSQGDSQASRLQALIRAGFLDQRIQRDFDAIGISPGEITQDTATTRIQAFRAVRRCFQLGVWFHRLLSGDRELIPFIPPQLPDTLLNDSADDQEQKSRAALRAEFSTARHDLESSRVTYSQRQSDSAEAWTQARQAADEELGYAAAGQSRLLSLLEPFAEELNQHKLVFRDKDPGKKAAATERESLISSALLAAREPLNEIQVRHRIDELLTLAGWLVSDGGGRQNLHTKRGVAVREVTTAAGRADYLLYVDTRLVGVIEAKREGADLSAAEDQADRYATGLTATQELQAWHFPLPYRYVSDGGVVRFRDDLDPEPRSRDVYSFHQPETIERWMREAEADGDARTYRARLRHRLPVLDYEEEVGRGRLRAAQFNAVSGLEGALSRGDQRSLIQMATGAGKTYAAVAAVYRLLRYARAQRVLFLVDRNNLGTQALAEFSNFTTPDDGRKFIELYNADVLTGSTVLASTKVAISTIQRLAMLLSGQEPGSPTDYDDPSTFEEAEGEPFTEPVGVSYNAKLPPESFDLVIVDECHRSIYGKWRPVLEYFDAQLVGLTATPVAQTFGFFHQNLISEYTYEQAVADGVAVDYTTYRIRTEISERGSVIPVETYVPIKDRRTRRRRYEELDDDFAYTGGQVGAKVISTGQLRTVLTAFRDNLIDIFPERALVSEADRMVPKTLIFARNDNHADEIVEMTREVFGKGNEFCKKITAKASRPDELLSEFRNTPELRAAVTVDMIATGTDVRPIECVFFLRDVRSWAYFEQMRGRGARVINPTELRAVTPDIQQKTRFVVIDAIGVSESHKRETPAVERDEVGRHSLRRLLGKTASGEIDEDEAEELGFRLSRLSRTLDEDTRGEISRMAQQSLDVIVGEIMKTVDVDRLDLIRREDGQAGVHRAVQTAVWPLAASVGENRDTSEPCSWRSSTVAAEVEAAARWSPRPSGRRGPQRQSPRSDRTSGRLQPCR
jgi:type I restriction enzyme R subunit